MRFHPASFGLAMMAAVVAAVVPTLSQEPEVFRSRVEVIEVDVRVTGTDGLQVTDLTADDFTIFEDGIPQTITSFSFLDLSAESPVSRRSSGHIEQDTVTNAGAGRLWVILLGSSNIRTQGLARRFVDEALGGNDQVAVISVHGTMSSAQGFTRNRDLLRAAIDRADVGVSRPDGSAERASDAYRVLEDVSQRLGVITGGRKAVLFFDPPAFFMPDAETRDTRLYFAQAALAFDQRDALRAATRNNVAVYVVSTAGLSTDLGIADLQRQAGLRLLAYETGGDAIVNSNNFDAGFQGFVRDVSAYYLLGYVPTVAHRDGQFHRITVRVNRPGLTVRARPGYYAPEPDGTTRPGGEAPAPAPDERPPGLSAGAWEALRMPLSSGGLTIDLFAAPFRGSDRTGSVLLGAHVDGANLALGPGEPIEVAFYAMTTEGRITPGAFRAATLNLSPASRLGVQTGGMRLVDRIALRPGRHQVRFTVHQPNGRTGMVVADVEVPDFRDERVSLSGIVLASTEWASQMSLLRDELVGSALGADPTAVRHFARTDVLSAYVEAYARRGPAGLEVSATLATAGGDTSSPLELRPAGEPDGPGYVARIPLADLDPGEYVLTVEARAERRTAVRQVPFTVVSD